MNIMVKFAIFLAAGALAVGCAAPQSQELKQAEQSYSNVKDNPAVSENASVILYEAEQALAKAKEADDVSVQKHYAYLAQQKIDLAQTVAEQAEIRAEVDRLQAQQDDFLVALRRRQAQQARQEAEQAQQELQTYRTQERQQELTQAQREAQQAQQETQQVQQELQQLRQEMESRQTSAGTVLTLGEVIFEFDKAQLKTGAERNLQKLSQFLRNHPERQILIEGFTDSVGSDQYNRQLSQQRAQAVAQALQASGISPDRITTRGLGENYPVATNDTVAGRQENRRVEITILNPEQQPEDAGRGNGRM